MPRKNELECVFYQKLLSVKDTMMLASDDFWVEGFPLNEISIEIWDVRNICKVTCSDASNTEFTKVKQE